MSKTLEALVAEEKAVMIPPPGTIDRGWQALSASLLAGIAPRIDVPADATASAAGKTSWFTLAAKGKLLLLVGALAAGSGWYSATRNRNESAAAPSKLTAPSPAAALRPALVSERPLPAPSANLAPDKPNPGEASRGVAPRAPASGAAPLPAPAGDSFERELEVIRRAQAALAAGKAGAALSALDEHREQFPRGQFVEDRSALRALALCASGRLAEGQRLAQAALRVSPHSIYVDRLRTSCLASKP